MKSPPAHLTVVGEHVLLEGFCGIVAGSNVDSVDVAQEVGDRSATVELFLNVGRIVESECLYKTVSMTRQGRAEIATPGLRRSADRRPCSPPDPSLVSARAILRF